MRPGRPAPAVLLLVTLLVFLPTAASAQIRPTRDTTLTSRLRADEALVLFATAGRQSADGRHWLIPIHGWVYKPQHSKFRKAIAARLLRARYGLVPTLETRKYFNRRINLLFADNKEHRRIVIDVAGRRFVMPPTGDNGHFRAMITIAAKVVAPQVQNGGILTVRAILPLSDSRRITGRIILIPPVGLSIISDIDDTVKLTYVTDHKRMFEQTFFAPFAPVPDMAALYRKVYRLGVRIHFVSSSPWHLYQPLREFLDQAGFPPASIHLKQIRLLDASIANLFKDGTATKPPQIIALLRAYPMRKFILIGDSGEKDPETYAPLMRRFPRQIMRIYIRNVTNARRDDKRFATVFAGIKPDKWQLFATPVSILRQRAD